MDGTVVFGRGKWCAEVFVFFGLVLSGMRRAILHRLGLDDGVVSKVRGIERIVIVVPGYTELRLVEHWLRANARFHSGVLRGGA